VVESIREMNARFTCHVDKIAESVNLTISRPDPTLPAPTLRSCAITVCLVHCMYAY
jgi:hypothetical protein